MNILSIFSNLVFNDPLLSILIELINVSKDRDYTSDFMKMTYTSYMQEIICSSYYCPLVEKKRNTLMNY